MPGNSQFNHTEIESKWQKKWQQAQIYDPQLKKVQNPFYNLWMFPYPSAEGLHAGHAFASTGSDIYGRFMRMNGQDVFQPIGYDSFGIHSENFAIAIGEHPAKMLSRTVKNYERQLRSLGHGYDWDHTVTTSDIDYYKWTQWLFVELFKAGLAYRKKSRVNWCPSCKTVLADEQVINGACERCQTIVKTKDLEQWFFRITDYADRLLANLDKIDWPEKIKLAQRNWIGRSQGAKIKFKLKDSQGEIEVFTTRPDTLNAATFLVLSPDSEFVARLTKEKYKDVVARYIKRYRSITDDNHSRAKSGVFTGSYALNPETKGEIPIWVADYVVATYGSGAIMGVPAHDERDLEFAQKLKIKIIKKEPNPKLWQKIEKEGWGGRFTNYHLRDWLISRQRYWGPPIPMIYCQNCAARGESYFSQNRPGIHQNQSDWEPSGWYPDENLPIKLPYLEDYKPQGEGKGPLANLPEFYETTCPSCKAQAKRETDVSDTFLDSSWYFLRYPSVGSKSASKRAFDPEITKKWLPVSLYFGGAEHSVLHLMYARFMSLVLSDLGYISFAEPFPKFFAHGLMIKDGAKMSKSRGNVVNPDTYIEKFGTDSFRLYLMFIGPMDGSPDFRDTGIAGMKRFTDRVWRLFTEYPDVILIAEEDAREILQKMHQTIKKVTTDIQNFRYNVAIASLMEFVNLLEEKAQGKIKRGGKIRCAEWDEALKSLALMLAPLAPHLAEEVWVEVLGQKFSIHTHPWPKFNPLIAKEEEIELVIQINGKLRGTLSVGKDESLVRGEMEKLARKEPNIAKWLKGREVKKVVFVPGKLINFVTE